MAGALLAGALVVSSVAGASPRPSPVSSGKLLYYKIVGGGKRTQLDEIDPDGADNRVVNPNVTGGDCYASVASDNGDVLFATNDGPNSGPSRYRETYADGKVIHNVTLPRGFEGCNVFAPDYALSPNGNELAVSPYGYNLVEVLSTSTSKVVATPLPLLHSNAQQISAVAWGPGPNELTVGVSPNDFETWYIETVSLDGHVVKRIRTSIGDTAGVASLAVTKTEALFEGDEYQSDEGIYEVPLAGGKTKTVYLDRTGTGQPFFNNDPWSPQGGRMAITYDNVTRIESVNRTQLHAIGHGDEGDGTFWVKSVTK